MGFILLPLQGQDFPRGRLLKTKNNLEKNRLHLFVNNVICCTMKKNRNIFPNANTVLNSESNEQICQLSNVNELNQKDLTYY